MKVLFHSIIQYTGFSSKPRIRSRFGLILLYHKGSQTKLIWQGRVKKTRILTRGFQVVCFSLFWFFCETAEIMLERTDLKIKSSLDVMASALLIPRQN